MRNERHEPQKQHRDSAVFEIEGDAVFFQYLVSRGEAYGKKIKTELNRIDE